MAWHQTRKREIQGMAKKTITETTQRTPKTSRTLGNYTTVTT
jgi:hypothetical protein